MRETQQNSELIRDLTRLATVCTAAAELAGLIPGVLLEPVTAEIASLASRLHYDLIERLEADVRNDVTKIVATGPGRRGVGFAR